MNLEGSHAHTHYVPVRAFAPVCRELSRLLQPAPVEVLRNRTPGIGGVSRAPHSQRTVAPGRSAGKLIRLVPLSIQVALVGEQAGSRVAGSISGADGTLGPGRA